MILACQNTPAARHYEPDVRRFVPRTRHFVPDTLYFEPPARHGKIAQVQIAGKMYPDEPEEMLKIIKTERPGLLHFMSPFFGSYNPFLFSRTFYRLIFIFQGKNNNI